MEQLDFALGLIIGLLLGATVALMVTLNGRSKTRPPLDLLIQDRSNRYLNVYSDVLTPDVISEIKGVEFAWQMSDVCISVTLDPRYDNRQDVIDAIEDLESQLALDAALASVEDD